MKNYSFILFILRIKFTLIFSEVSANFKPMRMITVIGLHVRLLDFKGSQPHWELLPIFNNFLKPSSRILGLENTGPFHKQLFMLSIASGKGK